jgi:hypothetical protein
MMKNRLSVSVRLFFAVLGRVSEALVRVVGKPSKWSVKLPRNRLRGHVPHKDLANNVMDQNRTSGTFAR